MEYLEDVKELRRSGHEHKAESLLLELVEATEAEANSEGLGVAPGYYEQLAIFYRGRGDRVSEVAILERFAQQKHAPGVMPPRLLERLEKARTRLGTARE
jgi:DNA polymerase III subunit epsilon